jgi:fibronectin type 3 domain-containing protein
MIISVVDIHAYQSPIIVFSHNGKVYLRWKPERKTALEGCNVYRKLDKEEWIKCNAIPITRITDNDEIRRILGTQSELFFQLMGVQFPKKGINDSAYALFLQSQKQVSTFDLMCQIYPDFPLVMGEMFVDSVSPKGIVQYKIATIEHGKEHEIALSRLVNTLMNDTVPPITTLEAIPMNEKVRLRWRRDDTALDAGTVNGYNIYRSQSLLGKSERVNPSPLFPLRVRDAAKKLIAEQEFADKVVDNGTEYFYTVRAVNAFGFESDESITARAIPFDATAEAKLDISVEQFGNGAVVRFLAEDSVNLAAIELWKSTNHSQRYTKVFPVSVFQHQDKFYDMDIREGEKYFYFAKGSWKNGAERMSDTLLFIRPDKTPPSIPQGLSAMNNGSNIILSWKKSTDTDVEGYEIRRAVAQSAELIQFALTDKLVQTTLFTDTTILPDRAYRYYLYAVDTAGNYSHPAEIEVLPAR